MVGGKGSRNTNLAMEGLKCLMARALLNVEQYNGYSEATANIAEDIAEDVYEEEDWMQGILNHVIDKAVNRANLAKYTQLTLQQIQRSGGSEIFWHEMTSCIPLFLNFDAEHVTAAALLASLVKISYGKIRTLRMDGDTHTSTQNPTPTPTPVPRDVSAKLVSLELLLYYLKLAGVKYRSNAELVYFVRRLVVPAILANTGSGVEHVRVFKRLIQIVTFLWRYFRGGLKVEIAVGICMYICIYMVLYMFIIYSVVCYSVRHSFRHSYSHTIYTHTGIVRTLYAAHPPPPTADLQRRPQLRTPIVRIVRSRQMVPRIALHHRRAVWELRCGPGFRPRLAGHSEAGMEILSELLCGFGGSVEEVWCGVCHAC